MAFAVVLAGEGFAADGAYEGSFVGVGAEVRAEVVGPGEAFGAEVALEGCWVFLDTFFTSRGGWAGRVGEFQDVVSVGNGRCGGAAGFSGGGVVARGAVGSKLGIEWRERTSALVATVIRGKGR